MKKHSVIPELNETPKVYKNHTVKTEYGIGTTVWFMNGSRAVSQKINVITINIIEGNILFTYFVSGGGVFGNETIQLTPLEFFRTKEELINSL